VEQGDGADKGVLWPNVAALCRAPATRGFTSGSTWRPKPDVGRPLNVDSVRPSTPETKPDSDNSRSLIFEIMKN